MPTPPSQPESTRSRYENGNGSNGNGSSNDRMHSTPRPASSAPSFLAPFLGAFAAVIALAVVGGAVYFGAGALHSSPGKNPLMNVDGWQVGAQTAKVSDLSAQPDIGWWTKTYDLPANDAVTAYLKKEGIDVSRIEPLHYEETKDGATLTYDAHAQVPQQLLRLQQIPWRPTDPTLSRFSSVVVLNNGLPAGMWWDTQNVMTAAAAGEKLNFTWQVHYDKNDNTVSTDKLPFPNNVFTQEQVNQYQTESARTLSALQAQIDQVNAQVQSDTQAKLAQVPANPPKPEMLSSKWGGDGSGEPTKSAERIGGGTVAGAAGGAAFGAAAGDAGLGAGIGAGVGLLGGLIYDGVSKNNDKAKYQRKIAAENAERMDDWHSQIKALNQQRDQIKQDAVAEREKALADLSNRIVAANGHVDNVASASATPTTTAPPTDAAPQVQPTADQPSGPIQRP